MDTCDRQNTRMSTHTAANDSLCETFAKQSPLPLKGAPRGRVAPSEAAVRETQNELCNTQ